MSDVPFFDVTFVDGPLDGLRTAVEADLTAIRVQVPDENLARLLRASLLVRDRKMAVLPTKTAVYRLRRHSGKVVPIDGWRFMQFEGWERGPATHGVARETADGA